MDVRMTLRRRRHVPLGLPAEMRGDEAEGPGHHRADGEDAEIAGEHGEDHGGGPDAHRKARQAAPLPHQSQTKYDVGLVAG